MNTKRLHISRVLPVLLAIPFTSLAGTTRYVWQNSPSSAYPYASWASAARTIQAAVDAALAGDEIVVTNGVYASGGKATGSDPFYGPNRLVNRVAVDKAVSLRSVNGPEVTIIKGYQVPGTTNGDSAVRCAYLVAGASLSGFTLTNGAVRGSSAYNDMERSGGGVFCAGSTNSLVTNCVIVGNWASYGGGVFAGTIRRSILNANSAFWGGGAAGSTGDPNLPCVLDDCTLRSNSAYYDSGGVGTYAGRGCTLNNCRVISNWAGWSCGGGGGEFNNCVIMGNQAEGTIGGVGGSIRNCTVIGNTAKEEVGGVQGSVTNSIIYYNTAPRYPNYSGGSFFYSCTTPLPTAPFADGFGNIDQEPLIAGGFCLSASSPCVSAGSYEAVSGRDIDGELWANPPAIGCDQPYSGSLTGALTVSISASHTNVATGFSAQFHALVDGRVSDSRWEFGDGTIVSNRLYVSHAWNAPGEYSMVLRAYNQDHPAGATAILTMHVENQPVHYVSLATSAPQAPYSSWATAATNIQDAIDAASVFGALVLVSNGVYQTGARTVGTNVLQNRVVIDKPLEVRSVNGPEWTVIQGTQVPFTTNGDGAVRCVYLVEGAVISGFTITNGATRAERESPYYRNWNLYGGGIFGWPHSGAVSNCVIVGNSASLAGAGAFLVNLTNCVLRNNTALPPNEYVHPIGGGAFVCVLDRCTITGNTADQGGGAADSILIGCELSQNSARYGGGGGATACTLYDCTLTENRAAGSGGCGGGAASSILFNCILRQNWAQYYGGGARGGTLNNCRILNNRAEYEGGGVYGAKLHNSLVAGNYTARNGGGAYHSTLNNCTVVGNSARYYGGGVAEAWTWDSYNQKYVPLPRTLSNCIIYSNTAPSAANYSETNVFNFCCTTPLPPEGIGNITAPPLFVDYASSNYRLQSNSPCINAGDNGAVFSTTDLDGNLRISGAVVDIGAYEFQFLDPFHLWLQQYGLACDGSADYGDSDADGLNNWQEWRCATCPTNAASVLKLLQPEVEPPGVLLRWNSASSRTYVVERATNTGPPFIFTALQINIPGQPGTTSFTDTNAPGPGAFLYRVGVED